MMVVALMPAQIDWVGLARTLFGGIEALAILVLLVLLIVGWAKVALDARGS